MFYILKIPIREIPLLRFHLGNNWTLYTPFGRVGSKFYAKNINELVGCTDIWTNVELITMLRKPELVLYVVSVFANSSYFTYIGGRHLCIVIGDGTQHFSIAVGEIFSHDRRSDWKNVYVSCPDPLLVQFRKKSFTIMRKDINNGHLLIPFFKLL